MLNTKHQNKIGMSSLFQWKSPSKFRCRSPLESQRDVVGIFSSKHSCELIRKTTESLRWQKQRMNIHDSLHTPVSIFHHPHLPVTGKRKGTSAKLTSPLDQNVFSGTNKAETTRRLESVELTQRHFKALSETSGLDFFQPHLLLRRCTFAFPPLVQRRHRSH